MQNEVDNFANPINSPNDFSICNSLPIETIRLLSSIITIYFIYVKNPYIKNHLCKKIRILRINIIIINKNIDKNITETPMKYGYT